jgi:glutathione peroxidase
MKRYSRGMIRIIIVLIGVVILLFSVRSIAAALGGSDIVRPPTTAPAMRMAATTQPAGPLDFTVKDIDGHDVNLADYRGKVVMIVNVASKCGFTPQYTSLEKLYETYKDKGLVILGFPANNFHGQEPGSNADIKTFCTLKYNVSFPMMSKISVKGDDQAPLYRYLTGPGNAPFDGDIGWNFTKFLVDRNGHVYARFPSKTRPDDPKVRGAIEAGLAAMPAM